MLKRFISYYRPHKTIFVLDMLASLLVALVGIVYPIITREMLNELIPNKQYRMIVFAGIGLLLLYVVRMLLNFFIQYYGHVMGVRMQAQMRSDMFRHLEKLPYSFYDNHETGKIMSRMTNDLMDISELAHHGPENLLISTISVIVSFVYLCTINPWLTLIIYSFQGLWNAGNSIYIYSEQLKTFNYAINQIVTGGIARAGAGAAAQVIMMAVPITVFVISQSNIIETMGSSGMKD